MQDACAWTCSAERNKEEERREKDAVKKRNKAKGKSNDTHGYMHALTNGTHRGDVSADYATLQRAHAEAATRVACITFVECGNASPPPQPDRNLAITSSLPLPNRDTPPLTSPTSTATVRRRVLVHVRTNITWLCMKDEAFKYVRTVRMSTSNARYWRSSADNRSQEKQESCFLAPCREKRERDAGEQMIIVRYLKIMNPCLVKSLAFVNDAKGGYWARPCKIRSLVKM